MKVKFAIQVTVLPVIFDANAAKGIMEYVKMADSYGIHTIGMGDSCFRLGESCTRITAMALAGSNCYVGMRPTNPWTRDPQVMAAFLANIDAITDGRAFMEIATGDAAAYSIDRKAATRAHLEEYVTCVRDLLEKGEGIFQGRTERVMGYPRGPVRISICAEGPKILRLSGKIGDAVSIGMGLSREIISESKRIVAGGAVEAGRDPDEVDLWFTCRTELSDDRDASIAKVRASLGSMLHHSMRFGLAGRFVPDEYHERIKEYVAGYVLDDHQTVGGTNDRRLHELGLADYAFERWGLAGNENDWITRIERLADDGAIQLWLASRGSIEELKANLVQFGEKVLPHFA